jgi:hypothetical protein
MLFDDLLITQVATAAPQTPSEFTAEGVANSIMYLTWKGDLLAEQYEIQRSPDGVENWTTIATVPEDTEFYVDAFLPSNTVHYYRIRALSSVGDSEYFTPVSARTYTEYETWKDGHRLEVDAPSDEDGDKDHIPLLMEYALDLHPRFDSNRGLPQAVYVNGKPGLRYHRARQELNYRVEGSADFQNWSDNGIIQESEILGLFVTATFEASNSDPYFFRLIVSE